MLCDKLNSNMVERASTVKSNVVKFHTMREVLDFVFLFILSFPFITGFSSLNLRWRIFIGCLLSVVSSCFSHLVESCGPGCLLPYINCYRTDLVLDVMPIEINLNDLIFRLDYVQGMQKRHEAILHITQRYLRLDCLS